MLNAETLELATSTYTKQKDRLRPQMGSPASDQLPTPTKPETTPSNDLYEDDPPPDLLNDKQRNVGPGEPNTTPASVFFLEVEFLQQVFAPFILRRLKSEVINDLPTKISIVERCNLEGTNDGLVFPIFFQVGKKRCTSLN